MVDRSRVHAELEQQRCLIEQQKVEMQRQQRQIQLLRQLTVALQSELDALRAEVQTTSAQPMPRGPGNGNEHLTASHLTRETMASRDES